MHFGEETAVLGKEGEADAMFGTEAHEERAAADLAKADDTGEGVDGDAQFGFLLDPNGDSFTVTGEPCALRGDVKRVEERFNRNPPAEIFGSRNQRSFERRAVPESSAL